MRSIAHCQSMVAVGLVICICHGARVEAAARAGPHGRYAVLTAQWDTPPPFAAVDFLYGPREKVGQDDCLWWQLEIRKEAKADSPPLMTLRALTFGDPLGGPDAAVRFERYILRAAAAERALEYRDRHTGKGLLPPWRDFQRWFIPHAARGAGRQDGLPRTAAYLGHTLALQSAGKDAPWPAWEDVKRLDLDRELLVGTGRNFKDAEGRRLTQTPKRQNYTYVPFTRDDYRTMVEAGINLFTVSLEQWLWIRDEPVFYHRPAGGKPPLDYPVDLCRSNYLGSVMFMDEPAIIMVGDRNVHRTLRYFSDACELLGQRVQSRYRSGEHYSAFQLESELKKAGVNLGAMRLEQYDFPAWETMYPTAYYQLAAGLAGIVHEGRYRLDAFDGAIARWTAKPRKHTPEEMLRYHYAFLRGAARQTGRHWGMSIYGQADPNCSPLAVTLAYDMAARYVWFWTSDHDHHLPWPEQLALTRRLKEHAAEHPRPSIHAPPAMIDTAIVIPCGWWIELGDLWWVRAIDKDMKDEYSQQFARLMRTFHEAVHKAMDAREDFDVVVDDGREIKGYRKIVRVGDAEPPAAR